MSARPWERVQFFRWAYAAIVALAIRRLKQANDENKAAGEENCWPAGQEWRDLAGSSRASFLRLAREEAGIPNDEFLAVVRSGDIDVDDLYEGEGPWNLQREAEHMRERGVSATTGREMAVVQAAKEWRHKLVGQVLAAGVTFSMTPEVASLLAAVNHLLDAENVPPSDESWPARRAAR